MGNDEETFSSNINKPSLEQVSEKLIIEEKKLNGEEDLNNNAEKCEFVPKSDHSNVSPKESEDVALMDNLETEAVAVAEQEAVEGGIEGAEGMHGAVSSTVDVETKMEAEAEAEAVVGGGKKSALVAEEGLVVESNMKVLDERVGGVKSDFDSADMQVMDSEGRTEVLAEETPVSDVELEEAVSGGGGETVVSGVGDHELSSAGPVIAAEEAEAGVETVDLQVEEVTGGDGEKNVSDIGTRSVAAFEKAQAVVETVDLQEEEATVGDGEKNVSDIGAGSVAAIEEAKAVVETVDLQEEAATVGDGEKNVSDIGAGLVAAIEEAKAVVETVGLQEEAAAVGDGEKNASDIVAESVAALEEPKAVVETVDLQVEGTVGDREEDARNTGISSQLASADRVFVGRSDDVVVDEAVAVVEGEKSITESDNLQSIATESVIVEEDAKMVVMPVESSSLVMTGVEKGEESAEGKESVIEEILAAEMKMEMETSTKVAEVTEVENVTGLQVLQFVDAEAPNLVKEEKDKVRGITDEESLVADAEMDDIMEMADKVRGRIEEESIVPNAEMEASKNSVPNDLQFSGQESVILASNEENKVSFPGEGIPAADTEMEKQKEAEMETTKVDDVESTPKIDDSSSVPQEEEDEEMVAEEELALADTELETETDVGESSKGFGEKRKRGKNSKNLANSKIVTRAQKIMDEDVCFICFDGGDLVLCDRRYVCWILKLNSNLINTHPERDK